MAVNHHDQNPHSYGSGGSLTVVRSYQVGEKGKTEVVQVDDSRMKAGALRVCLHSTCQRNCLRI